MKAMLKSIWNLGLNNVTRCYNLLFIVTFIATLVLNSPGFAQFSVQTKLVSPDEANFFRFGEAMALSGDFVIIGSATPDLIGAAHVFKRTIAGKNICQYVKELRPSNANNNRLQFGSSIASSGDYVIINSIPHFFEEVEGSAYIFKKDHGGPGNWGELKRLTASNGANRDRFGANVAIDDTIAVVSRVEGSDGIYIFYKNKNGNDNWGEVKKIVLPVGINDKLAVHQDMILFASNTTAHIFKKDQGGVNNWGLFKQLDTQGVATNSSYGDAVVLNSDFAFIGVGRDINQASRSGAVYLYAKDEGGIDNWGFVKKLLASDLSNNARFGWSLALNGDTVFVGAREHAPNGAAYLFAKDQGGLNNWGEVTKLTPAAPGHESVFGDAIAYDGQSLIVGDSRENTAYAIGSSGFTVDAGDDQTVDYPQSIQLNANVSNGEAPYSYSWSPAFGLSDTNSPNPMAAPDWATIYTVTVTDAHGCSTQDAVRVNVNGGLTQPGIFYADVYDGTGIYYAGLDGSNAVNIIPNNVVSSDYGTNIAVDMVNQKIYYGDTENGDIRRANFDGSDIEIIIPADIVYYSAAIALDPQNNTIYYVDTYDGTGIYRADLNGDNQEVIISDNAGRNGSGLALDLVNNKLYYGDTNNNDIRRANLDGSNIEILVSNAAYYGAPIALDVPNNKLYYFDSDNGSGIHCADLDGNNDEIIIAGDIGYDYITSIALDLPNEKIYYGDINNYEYRRANLDGSNIETVVPQYIVEYGAAIAVSSPRPQAVMSISPNPANLGQVAVGNTGNLSIIAENTGPEPMTIFSMTFNNNAEGEFGIIPQLPPPGAFPMGPAPVGAKAPFQFKFTPINNGPESGSLVIETNGPNSPIIINFSGEGTGLPKQLPPRPEISAEKSLHIADALGYWQELYFDVPLKNASQKTWFELPPVIENQVFDARFSDDNLLNEYGEGIINLYGENYPVTITAANLPQDGEYVLEALHDDEIVATYELRKGQAIEISDKNIKTLRLRANDSPQTQLPQTYALEQNYPNPFNPTTNIGFAISDFGFVELKIYDTIGQLVKTLVSENREAGVYSVQWDATDKFGRKAASGVYLYRLQAGNYVEVKKMLLLK